MSEFSINYLSKRVTKIYNGVKETSKKNKWKSGLIGGTLLLVTTRYIYCKLHNWYYSLPPGPIGFIPRIGVTLTTLMNDKWNMVWAMQYGVVFSIYDYKNRLTVFINDSSIAKQVLSKPNVQDRRPFDPKQWTLLAADDNTPSFISINGKKWFKMRQLMHSQLVRVMNTQHVNKIMNECIKNELEPHLKDIIKKKKDNLWYCREKLSQLTFNIIFQANFGKFVDFKHDKLCRELAQCMVDVVGYNIGKRIVFLFLFPKLARLMIPYSFLKPCYDLRKQIDTNIRELIKYKNCNKDKDTNFIPKDKDDKTFMDNTRLLVGNDNSDYTESQEIADIYLMFLAGTDTTSLSLEWGLLLLSKQPDIQNKIRNELLTVLSKNNIKYKENMMNIVYDINLLLQLPLFRACIHEILRISCVARTGVSHQISNESEDIWITTKDNKKYRLPKGCIIRYNVEAIHNDVLQVENWKNKNYNLNLQQICLENWLKKATDSEQLKFYQNPSFITFGHGKRDCVGKQLAMKEMRVILGYLLLNYKFSIQDEYMNMKYIPNKGGKTAGVAKPLPQIPLIVNAI